MCEMCYVDEAIKGKIIARNSEFHKVASSPFGHDDEAGMLNLIDAESRTAILRRADPTKVYDLSVDHFIGMPGWTGAGDQPYQIWMTHTPRGEELADAMKIGLDHNKLVSYSGDAITMYTHCGTHVDALCHAWYDDQLYNGFKHFMSAADLARPDLPKEPQVVYEQKPDSNFTIVKRTMTLVQKLLGETSVKKYEVTIVASPARVGSKAVVSDAKLVTVTEQTLTEKTKLSLELGFYALTIAGEVHTIENQGSYVKITLDLPGNEEFVAHLLDETFFANPLDIGDRVVARWSASDIKLLDDGPVAHESAAAHTASNWSPRA